MSELDKVLDTHSVFLEYTGNNKECNVHIALTVHDLAYMMKATNKSLDELMALFTVYATSFRISSK